MRRRWTWWSGPRRVLPSTRYPGRADEQNFIVLGKDVALTPEAAVRSTYGDLRPVRAVADGPALAVFVYPRGREDPAAERVHDSLRVTSSGFSSALGTVTGNLYVGRTAAGGVGDRIDLDGDGRPDAIFSETCGFILQLAAGKITAVETDRNVGATIQGRSVNLRAYSPVVVSQRPEAGF